MRDAITGKYSRYHLPAYVTHIFIENLEIEHTTYAEKMV